MIDDDFLEKLLKLPGNPIKWEHHSNKTGITIPLEHLHNYLNTLFSDFHFDMLCSHTVIDWLESGKFEMVYSLFSCQTGNEVLISSLVDRQNPVVPTVSDIWTIAEFQEREVYDLFGVLYDNHKDLRRLFLEDDWVGFPLRKDYQDDFMLKEPNK